MTEKDDLFRPEFILKHRTDHDFWFYLNPKDNHYENYASSTGMHFNVVLTQEDINLLYKHFREFQNIEEELIHDPESLIV